MNITRPARPAPVLLSPDPFDERAVLLPRYRSTSRPATTISLCDVCEDFALFATTDHPFDPRPPALTPPIPADPTPQGFGTPYPSHSVRCDHCGHIPGHYLVDYIIPA